MQPRTLLKQNAPLLTNKQPINYLLPNKPGKMNEKKESKQWRNNKKKNQQSSEFKWQVDRCWIQSNGSRGKTTTANKKKLISNNEGMKQKLQQQKHTNEMRKKNSVLLLVYKKHPKRRKCDQAHAVAE